MSFAVCVNMETVIADRGLAPGKISPTSLSSEVSSRTASSNSEGVSPSETLRDGGPSAHHFASVRRAARTVLRSSIGDGHRAHAARNGRDERGDLSPCVEVHVATSLVPLFVEASGNAIHADVDHDRAGFTMSPVIMRGRPAATIRMSARRV
jgi:hypothetical protein